MSSLCRLCVSLRVLPLELFETHKDGEVPIQAYTLVFFPHGIKHGLLT